MEKRIKDLLQQGTVIPAHPLALTRDLALDQERQRRLTRYYMQSGAGGVVVGVHTTQFEIRKPEFNLLSKVLKTATDEIDAIKPERPFIKVAGICGPTDAALKEAALAKQYNYHLGLLSMGGLPGFSEMELIYHPFLSGYSAILND